MHQSMIGTPVWMSEAGGGDEAENAFVAEQKEGSPRGRSGGTYTKVT